MKKTTLILKPRTNIEIIALIVLGLAADQWLQPYGQWIVNALVWAYFINFIIKSEKTNRKRWYICIGLASLGEILLCEIFGLYTYRENNIPLFVPPGHVLLYASGLYFSNYITEKWTWVTLGLAGIYAVYCAYYSLDQISLILFSLWCLMLFKKELRPLVTSMFLLALAMELWGTWIGNWEWSESIYFTNIQIAQANPPFAVGVLYCGLDFLVGLFINQQ